MEQNRPRSREKNVLNKTGSVYKRGSGLHTGRVGAGGRGSSGNSAGPRSTQRGRSPFSILVLLAMLLFGGGGILGGSLFSSSSSESYEMTQFGPGNGNTSSSSTYGTWASMANTSVLNTNVVSGAREKRTEILGNGNDKVTVMVYLCGTDLESKHGMATRDIQEMLNAKTGENVNVILYTGGASSWQNRVISSQKNQIYQLTDGKMKLLKEESGSQSMTDPAVLTSFIKYADQNFPANRKELILWDHGGGSVSGYGYDEKKASSGSMNLAKIDQALKNANVKFDWIGFDACLMATVETALTLDDYADYMIASEETEPGVGWYYTNWLKKLESNPSLSTLEVGKQITDDFVETCAKDCPGQKTTLSVVDLAETAYTVPSLLKSFSTATLKSIQQDDYASVSNARYQTREFAQSSRIDQVDLVHLAKNMKSKEGSQLADALISAVKYNRTSDNMTNAYGLSVYFPARKMNQVNQAINTYEQIGMDSEYARCIKAFASMEASGQAAGGGSYSPLSSLMGSQSYSTSSSDALVDLIGALLQGEDSGIAGLLSNSLGFMSDRVLDTSQMADYISAHQLDGNHLKWSSDPIPVMKLSEDEWKLVQDLALNVYYDDGEGYIDLGLDNVFSFDDNGDLVGSYDQTWLAVNDQPVAYYYETMVDDGETYTISGYIPALLNGNRVRLIVNFDSANPNGVIVGANAVYKNGETDTVAKNLITIEDGDRIDFICDYYRYDGTYGDSYYLGEQLIADGDFTITNMKIGNSVSAMYQFTDIYGKTYWSEEIPRS